MSGKRVVLACGVFDLLHPGHIRLLNYAKNKGDFLVVGINSDESAKRYKGSSRPIMNEEDRMEMLLALKSVDSVVIFDEDDPSQTIKEIQPDIYIKGGDYTLDKLPEVKNMPDFGMTVIIRRFEEYSTTAIIERIKNGKA